MFHIDRKEFVNLLPSFTWNPASFPILIKFTTPFQHFDRIIVRFMVDMTNHILLFVKRNFVFSV